MPPIMYANLPPPPPEPSPACKAAKRAAGRGPRAAYGGGPGAGAGRMGGTGVLVEADGWDGAAWLHSASDRQETRRVLSVGDPP